VSLLVSCIASWIAMEFMSRWYERGRTAVAGAAPARAAQPS
jgi:hypothetical protein